MFRLVLVSALVALGAGAPNVRPIVSLAEERILEGVDADITEVPYQLSLQRDGSHICGATIISSTRALTAAFCTDGVGAHRLSVRAGSTNRGVGGQVVQVSRISQHPDYDLLTKEYDISVLLLATRIKFNSKAQPIALQLVGRELYEGAVAVLSGWGTSSLEGDVPLSLQKVEVTKANDDFCRNKYGSNTFTARKTCYGPARGRTGACQGDEGGPLVVDGKLVGISLWKGLCADPPGIYTKISDPDIQIYINNSL